MRFVDQSVFVSEQSRLVIVSIVFGTVMRFVPKFVVVAVTTGIIRVMAVPWGVVVRSVMM